MSWRNDDDAVSLQRGPTMRCRLHFVRHRRIAKSETATLTAPAIRQ
jgi:hypothetical protein